MFTINQIKEAHAKVKSGADFPMYIRDMKTLGVMSYEHFVSDGHIQYCGLNDFMIAGSAKWPATAIRSKGETEKLQHALTIHQQGLTDYPAFCKQAAEAGVEKWIVDMQKMKCIYYDIAGDEMIIEPIPTP